MVNSSHIKPANATTKKPSRQQAMNIVKDILSGAGIHFKSPHSLRASEIFRRQTRQVSFWIPKLRLAIEVFDFKEEMHTHLDFVDVQDRAGVDVLRMTYLEICVAPDDFFRIIQSRLTRKRRPHRNGDGKQTVRRISGQPQSP